MPKLKGNEIVLVCNPDYVESGLRADYSVSVLAANRGSGVVVYDENFQTGIVFALCNNDVYPVGHIYQNDTSTVSKELVDSLREGMMTCKIRFSHYNRVYSKRTGEPNKSFRVRIATTGYSRVKC